MEDVSWDIFMKTGEIDAYLLYKSVSNADEEKDKDEQCRICIQGEL